nr:hypothetical protein [Tanacetum cinerariifolium]
MVVVTEDIIRQDLRLDDADGVDCLPTEEIFTELARMGYEKPPPKMNSVVPWPQLSSALPQDEEDEVPATSTPPSPTHEPTPPFHETISSPPQEQPTTTSTTDMTLLNTLLETCTTLSHKVVALEQDKVAHALEILKLKRRVKKLEKQRRSKSFGLKRLRKVGTSQRVESSSETVGRLEEKDKVNAAAKEVNIAEPIVFNDKEVTMTMAQALIKMKAEKARILDEQMAKSLQDEEIKQAAAIVRQEQDDFKRAQELQQQYDQKQENIDWNVVAEQMQEKHLDNIKKYQSLKRKPISVAQARNNMIIYLKNMAGYKIAHFKGSHSTQDTPTDDPKEMSEEDVKNMLQIVSVSEFKVEALQMKYPLIDWEIYSEGSRTYWKIVRVGRITQAYQSFEDMLKDFVREDLDALWRLVKDKFSSAVPTVDKEKALWLHSNYGVHQVSLTTKRHDMYMLTEKDYPLSNGIMTIILSSRLQVDEDCEMARDLVMKIFIKANQPKSRSLDTSFK